MHALVGHERRFRPPFALAEVDNVGVFENTYVVAHLRVLPVEAVGQLGDAVGWPSLQFADERNTLRRQERPQF
nr:hypothetical protein [Haloarcula sp. CBA1127]